MVIYLITNRTSGKVYVGKTVSGLRRRWASHCSAARHGSNQYIHRAIRKHGIDAFDIQEVASGTTIRDLHDLERAWIIALRSRDQRFGYNQSAGGEAGAGGIIHTPEVRRKIAASLRGQKRKPLSDDTRQKIRNSLLGRKCSPETIQKHRAWRASAETRQKMSSSALGRVFSEEHRKRISEALRAAHAAKPFGYALPEHQRTRHNQGDK
jgi:group I intron endonuclease